MNITNHFHHSYHHHSHSHHHNHHHYHTSSSWAARASDSRRSKREEAAKDYHTHHRKHARNGRRYSYESISSGFSGGGGGGGGGGGNDSDGGQGDDLEGTVNLKGVHWIHRRRYSIGKKLGQGTFGLVVECIDNKRKFRVAVKIVRSVKRYLDAAEIEVDILNRLDELDRHKNSLIIRLYKHFRCEVNGVEHSFLVFERCGRSLYDFIKKNKYVGFGVREIACIGYQLLHAIAFCHRHRLTHTDLKLENVLFLSSEYARDPHSRLYLPTSSDHHAPLEIRLIDFGGATFECDHHSSIINTRQYRGPEVILGLRWSHPSDIWSIGCILAELYCGELLFATHHDAEHLQLMKKILGVDRFPRHMVNTKNAELLKPQPPSKYIEKCKRLSQLIGSASLCDLVAKCLHIDPQQRIKASQAKSHPFFEQFRNRNPENAQFNKLYDKINNH